MIGENNSRQDNSPNFYKDFPNDYDSVHFFIEQWKFRNLENSGFQNDFILTKPGLLQFNSKFSSFVPFIVNLIKLVPELSKPP